MTSAHVDRHCDRSAPGGTLEPDRRRERDTSVGLRRDRDAEAVPGRGRPPPDLLGQSRADHYVWIGEIGPLIA